MRQGLAVVMVLILPSFWRLNGVWLSSPLAEITMVFVAVLMLSVDWKKRSRELLPAPIGPEMENPIP